MLSSDRQGLKLKFIASDVTDRFIKVLTSFGATIDFDGNPVKAVKPEAIENAKRFFLGLPPQYRQLFVPEEELGLTPHGTVVFDWYVRGSFVSAEVGLTKMGFFSELPSGHNYTVEDAEIGNDERLMSALKELFGV